MILKAGGTHGWHIMESCIPMVVAVSTPHLHQTLVVWYKIRLPTRFSHCLHRMYGCVMTTCLLLLSSSHSSDSVRVTQKFLSFLEMYLFRYSFASSPYVDPSLKQATLV